MDFDYLLNLAKSVMSTGLVSILSKDSNVHHGRGVISLQTISDIKKKNARSQSQDINFLALVIDTSERKCSKPRDRFYALIGLALLRCRRTYRLNMICPLYLNYAKWEVQRPLGPVILLFACARSQMDGLPSWCPNFNAPPKVKALGPLAFTTNYHAGFQSRDTNTTYYITCIPNSNIIMTQGFLIDRILNMVPSGWRSYVGSDCHQAIEAAPHCLTWEASCLKLSQEVYKQPYTVPEGHWRTLIANKIISNACVVDQRREYHLLRRLLQHISVYWVPAS